MRYGFGCGTVFSISKTGGHTVLYSFAGDPDGKNPGGLINVNGTLYGTTTNGATGEDGTIYSITTAGVETVL
jgi:uncharacterized repeat protein (TIGR03803 family)